MKQNKKKKVVSTFHTNFHSTYAESTANEGN